MESRENCTDNWQHKLTPAVIAEVGCGAGSILRELAAKKAFENTQFYGYDISPQAIQLAKQEDCERVLFFNEDMLSATELSTTDILLIIDVFEHVSDYIGFIERCKGKADYRIFHIPLDIHVSSVLRNSFISGRYSIGHLHYFTADSAIATLRDCGYEIVDFCYTDSSFGLFRQHPSLKKAVANIPRWFFAKFSLPFAARAFGGYSLLVLAK